jgi:DNA-directed RNA polymerase subunit RPC12/RpoP
MRERLSAQLGSAHLTGPHRTPLNLPPSAGGATIRADGMAEGVTQSAAGGGEGSEKPALVCPHCNQKFQTPDFRIFASTEVVACPNCYKVLGTGRLA